MIFFSTLFGLYRSSSSSSSSLLLLLLRWRTEHFFSRTIVQSQFFLLLNSWSEINLKEFGSRQLFEKICEGSQSRGKISKEKKEMPHTVWVAQFI
jgi:hypothetical protein